MALLLVKQLLEADDFSVDLRVTRRDVWNFSLQDLFLGKVKGINLNGFVFSYVIYVLVRNFSETVSGLFRNLLRVLLVNKTTLRRIKKQRLV